MDSSFYHCELVTIKRQRVTRRRGKTVHSSRKVCAKAAYNIGGKVTDLNTGKTYNCSSKKDVVMSEIILPPGRTIPITRDELWSLVEACELRYDSWLAREVKLALPHFISQKAKRELALAAAKWLSVFLKTPVDVALHRSTGKGKNPLNDHAHLLFPTRFFDDDGLGKKHRNLDNKLTSGEVVETIRKAMADLINEFIAKEGFDVRVDHRSNKERGIDEAPTKHDGPARRAIKRKIDTQIQETEVKLADELDHTVFSTTDRILEEMHEIHGQILRIKNDFARQATGSKRVQGQKNPNDNSVKPKIPEALMDRFFNLWTWWTYKRGKVIATKNASIAIDTGYVSLRHLMRSMLPGLALPKDKRKDNTPQKSKEAQKESQIQEAPKKPSGLETLE